MDLRDRDSSTVARADLTLGALVLVAALSFAGCGGDPTQAGTTTARTDAAGAPSAPTTPATAPTAPVTSESRTTPTGPPITVTPPPTKTTPAPPAGGAADEQPVRVPASFRIAGGRLTPPTITVPAFLAVEIGVVSRDARPWRIRVATPHPAVLSVPAHGHASVRLPGQRAGSYRVSADGGGAATLVVGGEPGP